MTLINGVNVADHYLEKPSLPLLGVSKHVWDHRGIFLGGITMRLSELGDKVDAIAAMAEA